jgi:hypothetical protein
MIALVLVLPSCSFDASVPAPTGSGGTGSDAGESIDSAPGDSPDASPAADDAAPPADAGSTSSIEPTGGTTESGTVGGSGGGAFGPFACPAGSIIAGFEGEFYLGGDNGAGFCNVKATCASLAGDGQGGVTRTQTGTIPAGIGIGDCDGQSTALPDLLCPDDTLLVGFSAVRSGLYQALTVMTLDCASLDSAGNFLGTTTSESWGSIIGSSQGPNSTACPGSEAATGIYGARGAVIDRLGLRCQSLSVTP